MSGQGYNFHGEKAVQMRKRLRAKQLENQLNEYADLVAESKHTDDAKVMSEAAAKMGITMAAARKLQQRLDRLYSGEAA